MFFLLASCVICLCLGATYIYYQRWVRFFTARGVDCVKPVLLLGNQTAMLMQRKSFPTIMCEIHVRFKHKGVYGFFDMANPMLMVCEPELIKRIMIKDFDHFVDHNQFLPYPDAEPLLSKSLFCLTGDRWRDMRTTLSPAFTGNKIRTMFHLVVECSRHFSDVLRCQAKQSDRPYIVEMKDLTMRYANDVIASTAFGIKVDSLLDRDNAFYQMANDTTELSRSWFQRKMLLMTMFPKLCLWVGLRMFTPAQYNFYNQMVHDTISHRRRHNIVRPDMIQLLMDARRGFLQYEASKHSTDAEGFACTDEIGNEDLCGFQKRFWEDDDVTSQCYLFLLAGSESTSTLLSFAAYELCANRPVQERLFAELDAANSRLNGGPVTYDVLTGLQYLDMVISETLRKWPPNTFLDRKCTKDYTLTTADGRCIELKTGDGVWVPVHAMQRDPELYPEPDIFDPERFSKDRRHTIQPFTYLPLGSGPRNCIGSRFVLMEVKAFLFYILTTFTLEMDLMPGQQPVLNCGSWILNVKNGVTIRLRSRN